MAARRITAHCLGRECLEMHRSASAGAARLIPLPSWTVSSLPAYLCNFASPSVARSWTSEGVGALSVAQETHQPGRSPAVPRVPVFLFPILTRSLFLSSLIKAVGGRSECDGRMRLCLHGAGVSALSAASLKSWQAVIDFHCSETLYTLGGPGGDTVQYFDMF